MLRGLINRLRWTIISPGIGRLRGQLPIEWYVERGLTIGARPKLLTPFVLDISHCWLISIGDDVTFAPGVRVIAHDASTKLFLGYTRLARVTIGDRVFVGAESTILPGVTIGDDVVIGAGSVVTADIPHGTVAVGCPARPIGTTEAYRERIREEFAVRPQFDESWTTGGGISAEQQAEMRALLDDGAGYVV